MAMFTPTSFAAHLVGMMARMKAEEHHILERAAQIVEKEAKAEIGHLQGQAGPFVAWAPLAESTIEGWRGHPGKAELGFSPPDYDPLLRSGDMRDSIEHVVIGDTAHVGSDSMVAVWQELGTVNVPPRSFLGGAAVRRHSEINRMAGRYIAMFLSGTANPTITPIP